jgi:hypothetical protein
MNYAFGILIYYRQKSIIRQKIYIKYKTLTARIEPKLSAILLHHSTPTLPLLTNYIDIFKNTSQFTEYFQYFTKIYSKFCFYVLNAIYVTYGNLVVRI